MAAYLSLATAIGFLSSVLIERPALALRDRLFPAGLASRPAVAVSLE